MTIYNHEQRATLAKAPKHYRKRIIEILDSAKLCLSNGLVRTAKNLLGAARKIMQDAINDTLPVRLKFNSKVLRVLNYKGWYVVQLINGAEVIGRNVRQCEAMMKERLA